MLPLYCPISFLNDFNIGRKNLLKKNEIIKIEKYPKFKELSVKSL